MSEISADWLVFASSEAFVLANAVVLVAAVILTVALFVGGRLA
jgi:hypothetical protein